MSEKEQGHSEPVWNVDEFLERVDNDQVLLRELLTIFKEDFPRTMQSLETAVTAQDLKSCARLSHTLMDLLVRELHRSHREQKSTAILLGDVDHFRRVNDALGHVVGDEVLIEIPGRLLKSVRSYDFVGGYGGEEFIVVLSNCNPSYAPGRAEEIRKSISNRPLQTGKGPLILTMSFGVLLSSEWGQKPVEELLHEVDVALCEAKAAGRDCLRMAQPGVKVEVSQEMTPQAVRRRR